MGRFAVKYTPEQRQAVIDALNRDKIKPARVVEMAAAGELADLEPFTIPYHTARKLGTNARAIARRQPPGAGYDPTNALEGTTRQMARMLERSVTELEQTRKPIDLVRLKACAAAAREIQALALKTPADKPAKERSRAAKRTLADDLSADLASNRHTHIYKGEGAESSEAQSTQTESAATYANGEPNADPGTNLPMQRPSTGIDQPSAGTNNGAEGENTTPSFAHAGRPGVGSDAPSLSALRRELASDGPPAQDEQQ